MIASASVLLVGGLASTAAAQRTWFAAIGGGATVPRSAAAMDNGWVTELMGGVILPGNIVSLRAGGTYGQNRMSMSVAGVGMTAGTPAETDHSIGAMAGIMVMPDLETDFIPYVMASAGVMNGKYKGTDPSFAWASGAGLRVLTDLAEFYGEARFVRSTGRAGHGDMIPITAGVRLSRW